MPHPEKWNVTKLELLVASVSAAASSVLKLELRPRSAEYDLHIAMTTSKPDLIDAPVTGIAGLSTIYVLRQKLDSPLVQG